MLADLLRSLADPSFKGWLWQTTEELYGIEQRFGFDTFEKSARYTIEKLKEADAEEVELIAFPADGRTAYWDARMPLAWQAEMGKLEVTRPAHAFPDPVIAEYDRNPLHLAMWCASTPPGGVASEIVTENMMLAGHSVRGRIVLVEPGHHARQIYRTVCDRGGIGILSDRVGDRFSTPDALSWLNNLTEGTGWYPTAEDRELLGFSITPRTGDILRRLLIEGKVKVRAEVRAHKGPGKLYAATGVVKGAEKPDEEIWLAAHLYEPLGADNSPGAAVALAACHVLQERIRSGALSRPARTIRFAFTLERYGFSALAKTLSERGKRLLASFTVDTCAVRQGRSKEPLRIHLSPAVNPLYSDTPIKCAADICLEPSGNIWTSLAASEPECEPVEYHFRPGYLGNDAFLGDPLLGGPSFHFFAVEGHYWHNSENTLDLVHRGLQAVMVPIHAGLAHRLACLGREDAGCLIELVEQEGREYLQDAMKQSAGEESDIAEALRLRLDQVKRRLVNLDAWTGADVSAALSRISVLAGGLLKKSGAGKNGSDEHDLSQLSAVERRARTAIFKRTQPSLPINQTFAVDLRERKPLSGQCGSAIVRMDGRKDLLAICREINYFEPKQADPRALLRECLYLARHGYLEARFTEVVKQAELVAGLRQCGIREGDLVLVHSSTTAFGHIEGGADTVVDAVLESVGPKGTVLMPVFTRGMLNFEGHLSRDINLEGFHPGLRRTWTGAAGRAMLACEGVVRSLHPSHSVAGLGPLAEACLNEQRVDHSPTGPTSAFAKIVEHGGKIVYLGAGLGCSTFLHYLEDKLDLPFLTSAVCTVLDEHGETKQVFTPKHLAGHRDFYRGEGQWQDAKIFQTLQQAGLKINCVEVGLGNIRTVDARQFEETGLHALRQDPTLVLCASDDCLFCTQAREHFRPAK